MAVRSLDCLSICCWLLNKLLGKKNPMVNFHFVQVSGITDGYCRKCCPWWTNSFTIIQLSSSLLLSYVNIHQQGLSEICWSTVNAFCRKGKKCCYPRRVDFFFQSLLIAVVRAVFERILFSRSCNRDFYWDSLVKIVTGLLRRLLEVSCLHPGQAFSEGNFLLVDAGNKFWSSFSETVSGMPKHAMRVHNMA